MKYSFGHLWVAWWWYRLVGGLECEEKVFIITLSIVSRVQKLALLEFSDPRPDHPKYGSTIYKAQ